LLEYSLLLIITLCLSKH